MEDASGSRQETVLPCDYRLSVADGCAEASHPSLQVSLLPGGVLVYKCFRAICLLQTDFVCYRENGSRVLLSILFDLLRDSLHLLELDVHSSLRILG
jgi:hypothetical protein